MTQPIKVWVVPPGPNPWKVILILEELAIPYTIHSIKFDALKKAPFTSINPNGRNPAIEDPNTGLVLWESGAIIQYLVEQYDVENKLTYTDVIRRNHLNQYLMFQMSGQGPYFGQANWFSYLHPEPVPSAIARYQNEARRVLGVLDNILTDKEWLVGDKITYADLAFLPWNNLLDLVLGVPKENMLNGYPNVEKWHGRMAGRPSWKKCVEMRVGLMDEQGLGPNGMPKDVKSFQEFEEKGRSEAAADE